MTTTFSPHDLIGVFAAGHPQALATLDALRLDYCCHGSRTIAQACEAAGLAVDDVLRALADALEKAPAQTDGARAQDALGLMEDITGGHHARARAAFERIDVLMPRVAKAHGGNDPRLIALQDVVTGLRDEMLAHMEREELVLFPWILRLLAGERTPARSVRQPIDCMEHDHVEVAAAFERARELTNSYASPAWACMTYASLMQGLRELEADTRLHIHKENNLLFPLALAAERGRGGDGKRGAS